MNRGGGEKARLGRDSDKAGGRVAPARPKKGLPRIPTPSSSGGTLQILNVRVAVPGEPPALPPRRAKVADADFAASDPVSTKDPESLKGWRGFNDSTFDGLGVVPGASSAFSRQSNEQNQLLDMAVDTQESVSTLLKHLRPLQPVVEREEDSQMKKELEALQQAPLTAPTKVDAKAAGLKAKTNLTSTAVLRSSKDSVLDQLSRHEAHFVKQSIQIAREAAVKDIKKNEIADRVARNERLIRRLTNAGFSKEWSRKASEYCPERDGAYDFSRLAYELENDDLLTPHQRRSKMQKAERQTTEQRLAETMDWLCIRAPVGELPESFRKVAEVNLSKLRQLESRKKAEDSADAASSLAREQSRGGVGSSTDIHSGFGDNTDSAAADLAALAGTAAREDPHVALLQRAMLSRLGHYGFSRVEAREALERCGWVEQDATYVLLRKLHPEEEEEGMDASVSDSLVSEAIAERSDEALALSSILEDKFTIDDVENLWTVEVDAHDENTWLPCFLEVHFPSGDLYPTAASPIIAIRQENLPPAIKRSIAASLCEFSHTMRGEPVVFALTEWLKEFLPAILEEHGAMDADAVERAAQVQHDEESRLEQEAAETAKQARGFLSGHTKFERTFAKIEQQRESEKEELAKEKQRRAAYLRVLMETESLEADGVRKQSQGDMEDDDEEDETDDPLDDAPLDPTETLITATAQTREINSDDDVLSTRLDLWEAEQRKRVEAASSADTATSTTNESFSFEGFGVIQPNKVRTKKAEREETEKLAAERARVEKETERQLSLATAKGRRAAARVDLYESATADLSKLSLEKKNTEGGKKKPSWLTKHVKTMGFDKELLETEGAEADADELTNAAAELLSTGTAVNAHGSEDSAERLAERQRLISQRLLASEQEKQKDKTWQKMQVIRKNLPAHALRAETLALIETSRASVVSGATGCGKTTQVPQFIIEDAINQNRGGECSVIVTQPRRLSAMAVAERVANERNEKIGNTVGYSIRLESKVTKDTRLLFCTTGILLRRLQSDPDLSGVSHVVVDEVHERDVLSDFLLVILRSLCARRADFRLVAMSATVDADLFIEYFKQKVPGDIGAIEIPGRTFPVAEYRLEDAIEATGYVVDPDGEYAIGSEANASSKSVMGNSKRTFNPLSGGGGGDRSKKITMALKESMERSSALDDVTDETRNMYPGYLEQTLKCLQAVDEEKINLELIEQLVKVIANDYEDGAVLIFLPGMAEIRALHERLLAELDDVDNSFVLVPLHSTLSSEEQKRTFDKPPNGVRKVVMATNIAETSITIDDVVFVIDAGRVRETQYDPVTRMSSLVTAWCSKASSRQRRGRAGRVQEGYCFHLYSSQKENTLSPFVVPEIKRVPLDALCLQIKILKLGDVREFLRNALEPPPEAAVASALRSLQELNAVDEVDNLTPLGRHLAELPVDAKLGKMILYGAMFSCLDPVLTIAAGCGFRSPFLTPMEKRDEADLARRRLAGNGPGATSDHLTLVAAYSGWISANAKGKNYERNFLNTNFLSLQTLRQISEMRTQYVELLDAIGFLGEHAGLLEDGKEDEHDTDEKVNEEKKDSRMSDKPGSTSVPPPVGLSATAVPFSMSNQSAKKPPKPDIGRLSKKNQRVQECLRLASKNASNELLVRAVICAGLYPNVATVDSVGQSNANSNANTQSNAAPITMQTRFTNAGKTKIITKGDGEVSLHPTSVVFGAPEFLSRFLVFHEKVKTTKVYLRDASLISPYPLLLFGGKITVDHERQIATCDKWIRFRASARVAVLFKNLKKELDQVLMRKIAQPDMRVDKSTQGLVRTIVELLENEHGWSDVEETSVETKD